MPLTPLPLARELLARHAAKVGDSIEVQVWQEGNTSTTWDLDGVVSAEGMVSVDIPEELAGMEVSGKVLRVRNAARPTRTVSTARDAAGGDLYSYIAAQGIHLPPEIVSRYVLSLRTKPFALLTGISGTGKTKLAQLVAEYYTRADHLAVASPDLPEDSPDTFYARVHTSLLKHSVFGLKLSQIRNYFDLPERGTHRAIEFEVGPALGGGTTSLRLHNIDFATEREAYQLRAVREFLRTMDAASATIGDVLRFDVLEPGVRYRIDLIKQVRVEQHGMPDPSRFAFVAVRPDWTDSRSILGYFNPLIGQYSRTQVLELLLRAREECELAATEQRAPRPYFLLLDEMNLAKVEHYFADFLSLLESRKVRDGELVQEAIVLHGEDTVDPWVDPQGVERAIPQRLRIPPNVLITGTVNIDETTYMFSPKVLDRSNVIEFHDVDLRAYVTNTAPKVSGSELVIGATATATLELGAIALPGRGDVVSLGAELEQVALLNDLLTPHHRHFGYRVINEIAAFLSHTAVLVGTSPTVQRAALDVQILQKVLPKLNGTHAALDGLMRELLAFALTGERHPAAALPPSTRLLNGLTANTSTGAVEFDAHMLANIDVMDASPTMRSPQYPRTAAKLQHMLRVLSDQGFVSFVQ